MPDASSRATKASYPALSLCDVIFSSVFDSHPRLTLAIVEFELPWAPPLTLGVQRLRESMWIVRDIERDRETIDAIEGHDDRAAGVMAGAYLGNRMATVLLTHGVKAPATFQGKIKAAIRLGIIEQQAAERLHAIRAIRNEFAHSLSNLSFASPSIAHLCDKLFKLKNFRTLPDAVARTFEEGSAMARAVKMLVASMVELPDTPRNTYMNSIKFFLLWLQLIQASAVMKENEVLEVVTEYTKSGDLQGQ